MAIAEANLLKKFCDRLKFEIAQEYEKGDLWGFYFKVGNVILLVEKPQNVDFCIVFYPLNILDKQLHEILDKVDTTPQFMFGLKSTLLNPNTSVAYISEGAHFRGFHISKKLFFKDPNFSIKDFDDAVQAVIGTGLLGSAYLDSFFGTQQTEQKISEMLSKASPDGMYY